MSLPTLSHNLRATTPLFKRFSGGKIIRDAVENRWKAIAPLVAKLPKDWTAAIHWENKTDDLGSGRSVGKIHVVHEPSLSDRSPLGSFIKRTYRASRYRGVLVTSRIAGTSSEAKKRAHAFRVAGQTPPVHAWRPVTTEELAQLPKVVREIFVCLCEISQAKPKEKNAAPSAPAAAKPPAKAKKPNK